MKRLRSPCKVGNLSHWCVWGNRSVEDFAPRQTAVQSAQHWPLYRLAFFMRVKRITLETLASFIFSAQSPIICSHVPVFLKKCHSNNFKDCSKEKKWRPQQKQSQWYWAISYPGIIIFTHTTPYWINGVIKKRLTFLFCRIKSWQCSKHTTLGLSDV